MYKYHGHNYSNRTFTINMVGNAHNGWPSTVYIQFNFSKNSFSLATKAPPSLIVTRSLKTRFLLHGSLVKGQANESSFSYTDTNRYIV